MKHWSDKELFDSLRKGDKDALSVLFLRHYDMLIHYGVRIKNNRSQVEECIQELFIYLFESSTRLGEISRIRAYLFKSLRRRILEKIKKEKRFEIGGSNHTYQSQISFSPKDIIWDRKGDLITLVVALNALPWRQREAVYLRYYNRLSTNEIAEIMGAANQTVLNTIHQAINNLRKTTDLQHLSRNPRP